MSDSINILKPSGCFEIQKIIGISTIHGNCRSYQVQWSPSWISGAHLIGCEDLIDQFENEQQKEEADIKIEVPDDQVEEEIENNQTVGETDSIDLQDSCALTVIRKSNEVVMFEKEPRERDIDTLQDGSTAMNNEVLMQDDDLCKNVLSLQEIKIEAQEYTAKDTNSDIGSNLDSLDSVIEQSSPWMDTHFSRQEFVHPHFQELNVDIESIQGGDVTLAEEVVTVRNFGVCENAPLQDVHNCHVSNIKLNTPSKSCERNRIKSKSCERNRIKSSVSVVNTRLRNGRESSILCEKRKGKKSLENQSKVMKTTPSHVCNKKGDIKSHQCIVCSKIFGTKEKLEQHKKVHVVCCFCEKVFSTMPTMEELRVHIETHKVVMADPLECSYCEKIFLVKKDLLRHEIIHTEERPYKCEVCQVGFNRKHDLHDHVLRHKIP